MALSEKGQKKAKALYDQMKSVLDEEGCSVDDFLSTYVSDDEGEEMAEESEEAPKSGPDKMKVGIILARMKKASGE